MIKREHWIDSKQLESFILNCQDPQNGGIGDRPGNEVDVFHSFFGIAALSLMGYHNLVPIDPVFAIPKHVISKEFPHIKDFN